MFLRLCVPAEYDAPGSLRVLLSLFVCGTGYLEDFLEI